MTLQPAAQTQSVPRARRPWSWTLAGSLALIALGIFVRAYALDRHFMHTDDLGVAKTIIDYKISGDNNPFAVGTHWTFAPLQFVFTWFLITPEQTYRELLFWGRLPSLVAGSLGLLAMIWFYRAWQGRESRSLPFATALLAFSWENIIFAKQMHNYALGVTTAVVLMAVLAENLRRPGPSLLRAGASGLLIGALAWMHYQVLFFVPAYFAALLAHRLQTQRSQAGAQARSLSVTAAAFLAAAIPLYVLFLSRHSELKPVDWARGPHEEFSFFMYPGMPLWDKMIYAVRFFVGNLFLVLASNLSFLPQGHMLFWPLTALLVLLFGLGVWRLAASKRPEEPALAVFLAVLLATWAALVMARKLPWGPTRHALVLAPIMAVTISEGVTWISQKVRLRALPWIISVVTAGLFASSAPGTLAARRDPFEESEIVATLEKYDVDSLITAFETIQPSLMKGVQNYFKFYALGFVQWEVFVKGPVRYDTVAWLSHRHDLNEANFERAKERLAYYNFVRGRHSVPPPQEPLSAYDVIYSKAIPSDVEIESLNLTQNGSNNFFFYILQKKK